MQRTPPHPKSPRLHRSAFTLVEMLVVIAIISILMTAGSIGLSGMGGKGVTSGVATAEALFDEARVTAMGRNLRSCVLVSKNLANNKGEDLRRIVVAYEATNADGKAADPDNETPNWVLSSRGAVLPDQTFFSEKFSRKDHKGDTGTIDEIADTSLRDSSGAAIKANSPFKGSYYIYEFNSQGISKTPGASFIIGSGARNATKSANEAPPRVTASAKRDFGGFVVWRNGRTSVFRSPEQMGGVKSLNSGEPF
jgi:prepilin-type N-terminal cleavage/methylation domain-containing protein